MKPAPFTYYAPASVDEAVRILAEKENARPLAGGQSLVPMMNFRYATPDHLVDLNEIAELQMLSVGPRVTIGAMTRQRTVEFSPDVASLCPILGEALRHVGHRQTRNRGTVGGSLCHLDPAAELAAIMMLHGAELTAVSIAGVRTMAMPDFALGFMTTALEPGEILTQVAFDAWPAGHGYGFEEYARRHGDFAIASSAVLMTLDAKGSVERLAVVIGGLAPVPVRLDDVEAAAVGARPDEELLNSIVHAAKNVEAADDAHVSAGYRQHLAGVLTARAWRKALARARGKALEHA